MYVSLYGYNGAIKYAGQTVSQYHKLIFGLCCLLFLSEDVGFAVVFFSLKMWAAVCSLLFYPSHLVFFLDNIRIHANARIGVISEDLSNTIELKYWSMICVFCHGLLD